VIVTLLGGAIVGTLLATVLTRRALPTQRAATQFAIVPPAALPLGNPGTERDFAISPDGRFVVYRSSPGRGGGQLAVRSLDQLEPWTLEGVTNAREPFVSADSHWVGFFDGDELKKVAIAGGPPVTICEFKGVGSGATWDADNDIVFATNDVTSGLWRVPARGGMPKRLTTPDAARHEGNHVYPRMLPGGRGVLFTIATDRPENAQVAVLDSRTGRRKTLIRGASSAEFVDLSSTSPSSTRAGSGGATYLIYASAGALRAVAFDLEQLEVVGEPTLVVDDLMVNGPGAAEYAVSQAGALVYAPGASDPQRAPRSLVWVDRRGREEPLKAPARAYGTPRVSPDGSRIVVDIKDRLSDIWIWDLTRETLTRLTSDGALYPIWTPDGRRIVYSSLRARAVAQNLLVGNADGAGLQAQLTVGDLPEIPTSVTPDGKYVVGFEFGKKTSRDITLVPLARATDALNRNSPADASPSEVATIVQTPFNDVEGQVSPDGHYLAYQSDESGRYEIYVRPFPQVNGGRWQISTRGGGMPVWAPNSQELFYLDDEGLLTAVPTRTSPSGFSAGRPVRLLETRYASPQGLIRGYDIAPDGSRFLMQKESGGNPKVTPARIVVVVNWFDELRRSLSKKQD
jgi:eukaryotic-like serine/threonine-protein kinase